MYLQAMLEDKMRETDWEVTQESIDEQVARESYLQWLREQEKRSKGHEHVTTALILRVVKWCRASILKFMFLLTHHMAVVATDA